MGAWVTKTFSFETCFNLLVSAYKVFKNKNFKKADCIFQTQHPGSTVFICHFSFDLLSLTLVLAILGFQLKK